LCRLPRSKEKPIWTRMNADLRGFLGLLSAEICVNPRAIFIYVHVDVHIVGRNRLFQHPVRRPGTQAKA
jgi:hypothetical protein